MDWKEQIKKELMETRELADYVSEDAEATKRLEAIQEKVDFALKALDKIEGIQ
ncbi:MAG TPA: hypothetical protein VGC76_01835 [Pyrinomonadaceae bacterium]|jgi:hypothetical protein